MRLFFLFDHYIFIFNYYHTNCLTEYVDFGAINDLLTILIY